MARATVEYVAQIRRAVLIRRSAHGNQLKQPVLHGALLVGAELEPSGLPIAANQRVQPGLMDRHFAVVEALDPLRIDVGAQHMIAGVRKAGAGDQPDVPRAEYGDLH